MVKKIYAELDRITFDSIKKSRAANGMIDENKYFRGLKEGDSVIFSCNKMKIEAVLKKIKKYNSISEYLKLNVQIGMMEVNSNDPLEFLNKMSNKKVRIYEVEYYPYEDDAGAGWGAGGSGGAAGGAAGGTGGAAGGAGSDWGKNLSNSSDKDLEDFISALFGGND